MKKMEASPITKYVAKGSDIKVDSDGKIFIVYFDRILKNKNLACYNRFLIKKGSYEDQLEVICNYINYFLKKYDTDDELINAYLSLKFMIDKDKLFDDKAIEPLIEAIYSVMFTETMQEKIIRLVDDNYLDDIDIPADDSLRKYTKQDHLESLEFTNQHSKILLRISFGMKIMSPIVFHYVSTVMVNHKMDKDDLAALAYKFFKPLLSMFNENTNIFNKLFVYVKQKVLDNKAHNPTIYNQRDIMGVDEYTVISAFVQRVLIAENIVKYKFNENYNYKLKKYKENVVGFNKTIIKYQLFYFIKNQYKKDVIEVTNVKSSDGLSGIDKLEMNMRKVDEGLVIISDMNVDYTMERLRDELCFDVSEEEIKYYRIHHHPTDLQKMLVRSFFAKSFGNYRDVKMVSRMEYAELVILLKRYLLLKSGVDNHDKVTDFCILPYILSGNVTDKVNTRLIRNSKFIAKVEESYLYQKLKEKYSWLLETDPKFFIGIMSKLINTNFTYCTYEDQSLTGTPIPINEDKIADELLSFLNCI